jgi:endonuclease/exonuclease/phosphatase family metal-dependent hydrolase
LRESHLIMSSFLSRILVVVFLAFAMGCAADAPTSTPTTFKVMTWNLEHFTDPFDDPYINNEMDDIGSTKSDAVLQLLAEAIRRVDADVMAFQEVESARALKFFLDEYMKGHKYKFFAGLPSMEWHQNVVVVSKFPLGAITSYREVIVQNPESNSKALNLFSNRLMTVEVSPTKDYSFILANIHLKAGQDPQDPTWRINMAAVVKERFVEMEKANPEVDLLWMGDMNCKPESREYEFLTVGSEPNLIDPFVTMGHSPTHPASGPKNQIDHLFVNTAMESQLVPNSFATARPLSLKEMASISDHLPLVASFAVE